MCVTARRQLRGSIRYFRLCSRSWQAFFCCLEAERSEASHARSADPCRTRGRQRSSSQSAARSSSSRRPPGMHALAAAANDRRMKEERGSATKRWVKISSSSRATMAAAAEQLAAELKSTIHCSPSMVWSAAHSSCSSCGRLASAWSSRKL